MNKHQELICQATGAQACYEQEDIQSLWSGYGKIVRFRLSGTERQTAIVKYVDLSKALDKSSHPRGWGTDRSHQRKTKSYEIESYWYQHWSKACDESCRVAQCLALESHQDGFIMVLEDLDASGYPVRKNTATFPEMQVCLHWLANFHATFIGQAPTGLWPIGTYWHLATRPDELKALKDQALKQAATKIDQRLNSARYQTIVHGDAKLANFCFSNPSGRGEKLRVAAVDFQYVGGGCGMKDVAYFVGSCLGEQDCERYQQEILDYYFSALELALKSRNSTVDSESLVQEWRALYPLAWTDFHRFVKGWSPGHWKIHGYSERIARAVISQIENEGG